jgi:membrane protein DedA with SNARE-associated domain
MSLEEFTHSVVEFVRTNQVWAVPIVFALAFGESLAFLSLILPATVILVALGGLMGASGIDFWRLWVAGGLGGTLGYAVSYWVGLHFKDSARHMWPFTRYTELIPRGEAFFEKYGAFAVFLGHFFGPVRAVIPVVAGMYGMRQRDFQIANVTSAFIWAGSVLAPGLVGVRWLFG